LRCWSKKGIEDLRKAKWYLDRLVASFDSVLAEINAPLAETPSDEPSEDQPPAGWRKMEIGEDIDVSDKFWFDGVWLTYEEKHLPRGKLAGLHVTHIRKIETPSDKPKRYREPTLADLANGPIACQYRDSDEEHWRSGFLVYVIDADQPFLCLNKERDIANQWEQCRIEAGE
jgi:hypothetical protein